MVSCAILSAAPATAGVMVPLPGDPTRIDTGRVAGTLLESGVRVYLGLPFAAPPVRELRWREPQPVKPWLGIYNADTRPPMCPQNLRASNINHYFGEELQGEDCLYLNLWAPETARPGAKLPVVVWIYGGGFQHGSASTPMYSGESLAKKGVIYVGVSYRVGPFGFMAHPELTKESGRSASGNYGLLDQIAALKWVQRNIASFGGDPANVTLLGESAGAMSINDLQVSPLAQGLFHRIIGLSGSFMPPGGPPNPRLDEGEAQGIKLQAAVKATTLAEFRAVPQDRLMAAVQQSGVWSLPVIDGYVISEPPEVTFAAGRQADVPVLVSSTAKDLGTDTPVSKATTLAQYRAAAAELYGPDAQMFLRLWPAANDAEATRQASAVGKVSGFGLAARDWARLQAATGKQPAYLALVDRVQPFTPGVTYPDFDPATAGAYHNGDTPYWMGTLDAFNLFRTRRDWTAWDRELTGRMQDVIVAFARTGNPSTAALKFPPYDPRDERRVVFGDSIFVERLNTPGVEFIRAHPARR
jgi:para-nitrobenzyl esterase